MTPCGTAPRRVASRIVAADAMTPTVKTPAVSRGRATVAVFGTAAIAIRATATAAGMTARYHSGLVEIEGEREGDHGGDGERADDEAPERRDEVTGGERREHRPRRRAHPRSPAGARRGRGVGERQLDQRDRGGDDLQHDEREPVRREFAVEARREPTQPLEQAERHETGAEVPEDRRPRVSTGVAEHRRNETSPTARSSSQLRMRAIAATAIITSALNRVPIAVNIRGSPEGATARDGVDVQRDEDHAECADRLGRELQITPGEDPGTAEEHERDHAHDGAAEHVVGRSGLKNVNTMAATANSPAPAIARTDCTVALERSTPGPAGAMTFEAATSVSAAKRGGADTAAGI